MSAGRVLRHGDVLALLSGRTVALLGNGLAWIAIAFAVLDLTGSATDLGLVLAARSLAQVIFLPVGGVVADRLKQGAVVRSAVVLMVAGVAASAVPAVRRLERTDLPDPHPTGPSTA